ncbi:MAG: ABC transporter permease [Lachnospiraceae bacterium]
MSISMNRLSVLSSFKLKELIRNKTFLLTVIIVAGMTFVMRLVYANMDGVTMSNSMYAMVLDMGALFNISMIALVMPATFMAKDKENNTLRTLMTSSVQGIEYFLSGVLPTLIVSVLVNVVVLLISGISITGASLALYFLVSTIACFSSCVIGMTVGIFSKNQMSSSNISAPLMLLLMMIPMFSSMLPALEKISGFLYTGVITNVIYSFAESTNYQLSVQDWCVLIITPLVLTVVFIVCYRKNGFDHD